jgi:hypothetical protein
MGISKSFIYGVGKKIQIEKMGSWSDRRDLPRGGKADQHVLSSPSHTPSEKRTTFFYERANL